MHRAIIGLPCSGKNAYYDEVVSSIPENKNVELLDIDSYIGDRMEQYAHYTNHFKYCMTEKQDVCIVGVCRNQHFINNYITLKANGYEILTVEMDTPLLTVLWQLLWRKRKLPLVDLVKSLWGFPRYKMAAMAYSDHYMLSSGVFINENS
jgi:hypothetical protein